MKWQDKYKEKLISAEKAAAMIESGQSICLGMMMEPKVVPEALIKRKDELENVNVLQPIATTHMDWFKPGYEKTFSVTTAFSGPPSREAIKANRVHYQVGGARLATPLQAKLPPDWCQFDYFIIPVSPPDKNGYVSLGPMLWMNKTYMRAARKVIAEVNDRLIWCYGDSNIHISELDYLVEANYPASYWQVSRQVSEHDTHCIEAIGSLVSTLVNDGDTIQIGTGTIASTITPYLEDKNDLGVHTELTPPGIVDLHRRGVITNRRKSLHPGKVIACCFILDPKDEPYIHMNPEWVLYEMNYTNDPRNSGSLDNLVTINNGLMMDLTGQVASEGIGPRMIGGAGGQFQFSVAANLSQGGRCVTVLQSSDETGQRSNILPSLPPCTPVTVPRFLTELVVTEYGIADLRGKTQLQRAEEMISIAHPDHRADLKKEAYKLYGPK